MISQSNRSDPFIIMLRDCEEKLSINMVDTFKYYAIQIIAGIVMIVASMLMNKSTLAVFCLLSIIMCGFALGYFIRKGNRREVNDIIFGDEYQSIDINRERILQIGFRLKFVEGVFYLLKLIIFFIYGVYGIIGVVYIVELLLQLIGGR